MTTRANNLGSILRRSHVTKRIAFLVAIILVGAVSAVVYTSMQRLIEVSNTANRTQIVLYNLQQLLSAVTDAEAGQRGYLLTGDRLHLRQYGAASAMLPDQLAQLRDLIADNADQQSRLGRIEALVGRRLAILQSAIEAFEARGLAELDRNILATGKVRMDQIGDVLREMVREETRLHELRGQEAERQAVQANVFFVVGTLASLLIISGIFFLMQREIRGRERAQADLHRLNARLEQLVGDRTSELEAEAEERRRRAEELQAVFDEAALGVVGLDADYKVTLWNRAAAQIFGYDAAEVVGRADPALLWPEAKAEFDEMIARAAAGERLNGLAVRWRRKDGKLADCLISVAPLYAADRHLRGIVFVLEDVTEKRSIQRQLVQAQKMEAIGQLSGGVAHDFNNLLAIAIGNLDLLQLQIPQEDTAAQELVESALKASLRGAELTKQLLAFSRRQSLDPRPVDVNALVTLMATLLRRTLGETIQISLRKSHDLWLAHADPTQVESALTNLAINARDAMPQGGRLTIETSNTYLDEQYAAANAEVKPGDYVMLAVSDTGTGIAPEILDRVFDPFFTTKGEGKGTGLGLSMIYGFAKQSGGHVKIYSELGHGTTVRIYLPRTKAAAELAETPVHLPVQPAEKTILVVEDNPGVRAIVLKQLRSLGYRALEADNAAVAIEILGSAEPVDLLFSDVVMPGQSGVELAATAKRLRPKLKVLLTSGFTEEALRASHATSEIPLLTKPYQRYELARMVAEVLHDDTD